MANFFISYTSADRSWADWIAWELRAAGYTTVHQAWDFRPGANFISEMKKAAESDRTIAVYSPNYFNSGFSEDEWTAAFADRSLIPVRVRECEPPALLRPIVYIDLVNLKETAARAALIDGVRGGAITPREAPAFPGQEPVAKPKRFPGVPPPIWEVPHARNPNFTGRDQILRELRAALGSGAPAALTQAIAGLGGVGKTQLALEYCYRYGSEYELVWWMRAETPAELAADYARLASPLALREKDLASQAEIVAAVHDWLTHHSGGLVVFDNATAPEALQPYLPHSNSGHVLITSRHQAWRGVAQRIPVLRFSREESIAFLQKRSGRQEASDADAMCDLLGDLPLAIGHAAAYMDETGMSVREYVDLYREAARELLEPVAATWRISFDKLRAERPAAIELLNRIAFLAPDNIPKELLLFDNVSALQLAESIRALLRYSLIDAGEGVISVHRLVQQVTRDRMSEAERRECVEAVVNRFARAFPDPTDYQNWPTCSKLRPHAFEAVGYAQELDSASVPLARILNEVGIYEWQRGQRHDAEMHLGRALAIYEKIEGPDHDGVAIYAGNLSLVMSDEGDLNAALEYAQRALAVAEKNFDVNDSGVAICADHLGQILKKKGDLEGALENSRYALAIWLSTLGPDHPNTAICCNNIGQILQDKGDLEGALQYMRRALAIDEKAFGPDHPQVAICAYNLGRVLRDKGDLRGALRYVQRALPILERVYGLDHPQTASTARDLELIRKALKAKPT